MVIPVPTLRHKRSFVCFLTAWLACFPVLAQTAVDLETALTSAYLNNPDLALGQAQLRATDEGVPQALAGWRPRIFLNGDISLSDTETDRAASNNQSIGASLDMTQSIYAGGRTEAGVRRAENNVQAERANLIALEQRVLLDAVDSYTATYQDRSVLDFALSNAGRLRQQLQATKQRLEVGVNTRTDLAQAEARLARANADIQQARANLAGSEAAYRDIIGTEPGDLMNPVEIDVGVKSLDQALDKARMNPDIRSAEFALSSARDAVEISKADLLPSLDLAGSLSYRDDPSDTIDWQRQAAIGLDLSIPLYQGGAAYSRVRESTQRVKAQQSAVEGTIRAVQRNVTSAWERLEAARASADALRAQVRANRVALEGVQDAADEGERILLDVLDAEQELFQSQVDLVSAERTAVLASYELKAAIGELTIMDLGFDTPTYDPEAYYNQQRSRIFGLDLD